MNKKYMISIDQSTQGTKALAIDAGGRILARFDLPHKQIINERGWVSHDAEEIYRNTLQVIKGVLKKAGIDEKEVAGLSISNQRETSVIWDRENGRPLNMAIVWQCARASQIAEREVIAAAADRIREITGINLSPYFPAAKIAWLLENTENAAQKAKEHSVCHGTVDSYLVFRLTDGSVYATDASNASRTQLFDIHRLGWSGEICSLFGIDPENMPEVKDSNAEFGRTTAEGIFSEPVPICGVMGDSHAALFGQNCRMAGKAKATYGTGSSIMMNIGTNPVLSSNGLVTSLAWSQNGQAEYVLEGNLNYTGAVITWLKDDLGLIQSAGETGELALQAVKDDSLYLVPAFSGLGAPYWDSHARAAIVGMSRTTKKPEIVRAALECIAYQITDIVRAMEKDAGQKLEALRVDGGPTRNQYLMQFQSDIAGCLVEVPDAEELSAIGACYMGGLALGFFTENIFEVIGRVSYEPGMPKEEVQAKYSGWQAAVESVLKQ